MPGRPNVDRHRDRTVICKSLGGYKIISLLGAGGMGEVYLAEDTSLDRKVAIKVLPERLSEDDDRLARFELEAKLLASLNHPNIATIYGLEEFEGSRFIVLELVEGDTLGDRIAQGSLPVADALELARQIARGLEAAHDQGVIHRDLKPDNVKIAADGRAKILDFGLAKAFDDSPAQTSPDTSESPTRLQRTQTGMIMGTAAYMSPEQARGKPLDKRTDIWSFGCVLYELLVGRRPFGGDTVSDLLVEILDREPDWSALPAGLPVKVKDLLRRCLKKDTDARLHDIADARIEIEEAQQEPAETAPSGEDLIAVSRPQRMPWLVAMIMFLAAVVAISANWMATRQRTDPPIVRRFALDFPPGESLIMGPSRGPSIAISPDGNRIAYVGQYEGAPHLFLRDADEVDGRPLPDTAGASNPFFSPDGRWVGFVATPEIKKISVDGSELSPLARIFGQRGAEWAPDNWIYYSPSYGQGIWRVHADGGEPEELTSLDTSAGETNHRWPSVLPGGRVLIFTVKTTSLDSFDDAIVSAYDMDTGERTVVLRGASYARYSPTGHLTFVLRGSLMAVEFDPESLETTGSPVVVQDGFVTHPFFGSAQIAYSESGTLVYGLGEIEAPELPLLAVDRNGETRELTEQGRWFVDARVSPNGRRILTTIEAARSTTAVYDISRKTLTVLSLDGDIWRSIWAPDSNRIAHTTDSGGEWSIGLTSADGSGENSTLVTSEVDAYTTSWSPDGRTIAFIRNDRETGWDIWTVTAEGGSAEPFLVESGAQKDAVFSPDGKWLAYTTNVSGNDEIWVTPFPGKETRSMVSTDGGTEPVWSHSGDELFYRKGDSLMVVAIETRPEFDSSAPRTLFLGEFSPSDELYRTYDVFPDGETFVLVQPVEQFFPRRIVVVLNWFEELRSRMASR